MKDLVDKLSSYNIFNYLLPGTVFVVLADALTTFQFVQQDVILGLFLYYFIGLIISRLGSLVVEPLLKRTRIVRFAPYADFVSASKEDKSIEVLSETNNMYRTFCSLFVILIFLKIYESLVSSFPLIGRWGVEFMIMGLLGLFCFSYRKQTQYIIKRIQYARRKE
ncbi:MAG: hypothetical protein P1P89_21940 [Desulfobacterales bacterium]|nr:hypothetical protein [Desulfobacterales bacterium]